LRAQLHLGVFSHLVTASNELKKSARQRRKKTLAGHSARKQNTRRKIETGGRRRVGMNDAGSRAPGPEPAGRRHSAET
jgi:hypothetical protein